MSTNPKHPLKTYWSLLRCKDRESVCKMIISFIENGTGCSINELKKNLTEKQLFYEALQHVVTTKKSLVKALKINLDNCCWYKQELKEDGYLVESLNDCRCPYTHHPARLLTTNKSYFTTFGEDNSNQLNLF